MRFTGQPWHTPHSPRQGRAEGEIGWCVSTLIVLGLVALLVAPAAYFMSQTGLPEKTIAISTLVAVMVTHVIKTVGR